MRIRSEELGGSASSAGARLRSRGRLRRSAAPMLTPLPPQVKPSVGSPGRSPGGPAARRREGRSSREGGGDHGVVGTVHVVGGETRREDRNCLRFRICAPGTALARSMTTVRAGRSEGTEAPRPCNSSGRARRAGCAVGGPHETAPCPSSPCGASCAGRGLLSRDPERGARPSHVMDRGEAHLQRGYEPPVRGRHAAHASAAPTASSSPRRVARGVATVDRRADVSPGGRGSAAYSPARRRGAMI